MLKSKLFLATAALSVTAFAQAPSVKIVLPERIRLLQGQQVDLVLEVRNAASVGNLKVVAGSNDITSKFSAPVASEFDCDGTKGVTLRADLQSFDTPGDITVAVSMTAGTASISDSHLVSVREFNPPGGQRRNVILFIGDAMGTAYRDAARLVSRSIVDASGKNSFREGFFDDLLEMDKMPVSGMSMTYASDSVVPDSANTATAWASGNKTFVNGLNVFADGNDCRWRPTGLTNAANLQYIQDNPRVESLWQFLKRKYSYRTGIVTTAAVTDATPAGEGSYTGYRQSRLEIARHYRENPMLGGRPAFDVILGGGADPFMASGRPDGRNLMREFRDLGYYVVTSASDLRNVNPGQPILGLFKGSTSPAPASDGIRTASDVNMDVAYDKLRLQRPASEPVANLGDYPDQPMLDLMTQKAIDALSNSFAGSPFILMVEGASIDKQSHPNQAAGTIWDTIEFDKAVGVARSWAAKRRTKDTLIVVTADHDQSMSIIGVSNVPDAEYFNRTKGEKVTFKTTASGDQDFTVYGDAFSNVRAGIPFINDQTTSSNNGGTRGMPGTFTPVSQNADKPDSTYSTYAGFPAYTLDPATGYPNNFGPGIRRLTVGYRTGDHTGSSVPVTAEGPGALLFTGYMDETDIFFKMAAAISTDTTALDAALDALQKLPRTYGK
jgi:alkaline phosphatase